MKLLLCETLRRRWLYINMSAEVEQRRWYIRDKWVRAAHRETEKQTKIQRLGNSRGGKGVRQEQCIICMAAALSSVVVIVVVSVVESQESGEGDDVTEIAWHVGQQLPHFGTVPHFCASLWRRCHLSGNLSDSWEWNEVRNQSHILFGNVSAVPILQAEITNSLHPPPNPNLPTSHRPLPRSHSASYPASHTAGALVPALWNKVLLLSRKECIYRHLDLNMNGNNIYWKNSCT